MSDDDRPGGVLQSAEDRWDGVGRGAYGALVCAVALFAGGIVGLLLEQPWLFPSLGPTVMVLAETSTRPAAHPRNAIVAHVVGVAAGYLALLATGLTDAAPAIETGLDVPRVTAAVLSVALTSAVLGLLRTPHPPAGATTLLVSLGLLTSGPALLSIVLSVLLVVAVATGMNALLGVRQTGVPTRSSR